MLLSMYTTDSYVITASGLCATDISSKLIFYNLRNQQLTN